MLCFFGARRCLVYCLLLFVVVCRCSLLCFVIRCLLLLYFFVERLSLVVYGCVWYRVYVLFELFIVGCLMAWFGVGCMLLLLHMVSSLFSIVC